MKKNKTLISEIVAAFVKAYYMTMIVIVFGGIMLTGLLGFLTVALVKHHAHLNGLITALWHWATHYALYNSAIAIALLFTGGLLTFFGKVGEEFEPAWTYHWPLKSLNAFVTKIKGLRAKQGKDEKDANNGLIIGNTGEIIMTIAAVLAGFNLFPFFNHLGILKWFLVAAGFIVILIALVAISEKLPKKWQDYRAGIPVMILSFYYLDIFIFNWNRPYLTGIITFIILLFLGRKLFLTYRKKQKIKIQKEKEKTEKRLALEAYNKKIAEAKKEGFYTTVINYFTYRKQSSLANPSTVLYLDALLQMAKENVKMTKEEKRLIIKEISFIDFAVDADFFRMISKTMETDYAEEVLFVHTANHLGVNELPMLFRYNDNKKEVIRKALNNLTDTRKFFNETKKEFRLKEFTGMINSITFSYLKEWDDEEWLKLMIQELEHLLNFATNRIHIIWSVEEAIKLTDFLTALQARYKKEGVQIKFPEIPKVM